jgi:uncharacterized membrane-anchored protein
MNRKQSSLLKTSLLVNAGFSLVSGLASLAFAGTIAARTGIPSWILYALGVGLLIFAADVAFTATRKPINLLFAKLIIGADALWIICSLIVLGISPAALTFEGQLLIELVAIAVAVIATLQTVGVKRLSHSGPKTA